MPFCQHCGANIPDNTLFCASCGTKVGDVKTTPANDCKPKLHCPKCKSHQISPINESSVSGGLTTHHGGVSTTHVSNQHRAFWMCADCGEKFRSIPSLEEEIHKVRNSPKICNIIAILAALYLIWTIIQLIFAISSPFGALAATPIIFIGIGDLFLIILMLCLSSRSRKNITKMKAELEYLKENCFN